MSSVTSISSVSNTVRSRVTPEEWDVRVKLAAAYRLAALYKWTDHIYTHFSARVPGPEEHFLINAFGLLFDEISASNLVKVDLDGTLVDDPTGLGINYAGYVIHSAIHGARHDLQAVLHTHTRDGIAVSAQKSGLLPISQHSIGFSGRVAYHGYEGIALDLDERERLVADLGDKSVMILRNHGLLTAGGQRGTRLPAAAAVGACVQHPGRGAGGGECGIDLSASGRGGEGRAAGQGVCQWRRTGGGAALECVDSAVGAQRYRLQKLIFKPLKI